MVARCCLILLILSVLKIPWVLEQPQSSILELSEPFQNLAKHFKIWKVGFRMFQFLLVSGSCQLLESLCKVFLWLGSYGGGSAVSEC